MGTYLKEELERKDLNHYVNQMEEIMTARAEGKEYRPLSCFECFYSMFGKCPVNGHKGNAACLKLAKSYFDMDRTYLEEVTEHEYKEALASAAKMYHLRMDYIADIFGNKGEKNDEPEPIH